MRKKSEVSRRVSDLRKARNETQAQFAETLNVTQPMVSAWESGVDVPSLGAYLRLGNKATYPDNIWFWRQAGMDEEAVLSASKNLSKERGAPPAPGEIIRIPRFRETRQGRESAGPPIPLPTEFIPNPASTVCLEVDEKSNAIEECPKGLVLLDTSYEGAEDLSPLWDRVVMLRYAEPLTSNHLPGIYMGRLVLNVMDVRSGAYHEVPHVMGWLEMLSKRYGVGAYNLPVGILEIDMGGTPLDDKQGRYRRWEQEIGKARSAFRLGKGIQIIGKVIGRLTGHLGK